MALHEPTQVGNPHQLTVRQHLLPRRTIERFCGHDGRVHARLLKHGLDHRFEPDDKLFCTMRSWDQKAEAGLGKLIEDSYQAVAARLADRTLTSLAANMHCAITEMYLLWRFRCHRARDPLPDLQINGLAGERHLDPDTQELLEKKGVLFIKLDGTLPGRMAAGVMLQMDIDRAWVAGADTMRWGVLHSNGLEFIVPDASIDQPILPVAPEVCLVAGVSDGDLTLDEVTRLNREAVHSASKYWFAHDVGRCPV